jgi:hypothetical protein
MVYRRGIGKSWAQVYKYVLGVSSQVRRVQSEYGTGTVNGAFGSLFVLTFLLDRPFCIGIALALILRARLALQGSC